MSRPTGRSTAGEPNVSYGFKVRSISVDTLSATHSLWYWMLMVEEAVHRWGRGHVQILYFLLNSAVNLKLPQISEVDKVLYKISSGPLPF